MSFQKLSPDSTSTVLFVSAVTVAVRAARSIKEISPTTDPARTAESTVPPEVASPAPERTMKHSFPGSPSRVSTAPAGSVRSSTSGAMAASSALEHPAKSGIAVRSAVSAEEGPLRNRGTTRGSLPRRDTPALRPRTVAGIARSAVDAAAGSESSVPGTGTHVMGEHRTAACVQCGASVDLDTDVACRGCGSRKAAACSVCGEATFIGADTCRAHSTATPRVSAGTSSAAPGSGGPTRSRAVSVPEEPIVAVLGSPAPPSSFEAEVFVAGNGKKRKPKK